MTCPRGPRPAIGIVLLWCVLLGACEQVRAEVNPRLVPPAVARLVSASGGVEVRRAGTATWTPARAGTLLYAGDTVRTGAGGRAGLLAADETLMRLHRDTTVRLKAVAPRAGWLSLASLGAALRATVRSIYELAGGRIWARNDNRALDIEFETSAVTAGVRGTELTLEVLADRSVRSVVLDGAVEHRNDFGAIVARAGEQVLTRPGQAPALTVLLRPRDAVQWVLSIPPLFALNDFPLLGQAAPAALRAQVAALRAAPVPTVAGQVQLAAALRDLGRADEAETLLRAVLPSAPGDAGARLVLAWVELDLDRAAAAWETLAGLSDADPRVALGRAVARARLQGAAAALAVVEDALLRFPGDLPLQVLQPLLQIHLGEVGPADTRLRALAGRHPDRASVWRGLAVTRLMLDDTTGALRAGERALALQPGDADHHLLLAYVHQARFDLERATAAARRALDLAPDQVPAALALARLLFGASDTEAARALLERARRHAPLDAQVHALAGFIELARRDLTAAEAAFDGALQADPALAEPHLGLAIVAMRRGDSARALEEMAAAVLLEPQRALLLSYWGKMLHQVGRRDKALILFGRAAVLDPNDPTPPFYRALVLRDLNRHGEAIAALHTAIEKNDNRAVYRSRFLLDRDLAVRNVDLSRLYSRLGLEAWATRKAYAAVKSDYTNASAHQFLAGALGAQEDRTYPLGSEVLLSLLFKPANANTFNSFNDYTTLFEAPLLGGEVTAAGGNHGQAGGSLAVFGATPDLDLAYNAALEHFATEGWRETNDERRADVFLNLKWEPTPRDGLFAFAQAFESSQHDKPFPRFEFDDPPSPDDRQRTEAVLVETGWHRRLSAHDALVMYGAWQQFDGESELHVNERQGAFDLFLDSDSSFERPAWQLQSQYMRRSGAHQWHAGALAYAGRIRLESVDLIEQRLAGNPVQSQTFVTDTDTPLRYYSVYVQDNWRVSPRTSVEAALYLDRLENADPFTDRTWTVEEVAPRLGLIFEPGPRQTWRAALFRYVLPFALSRTDPTDVAGVPIFRNTTEGAVITEADLAWEYEWSRGLFTLTGFGLEKRFRLGDDTFDGDLRGVEARFNWLATDTLGAALGYRFLRAGDERDPDLDRDEQALDARLKAQYRNGFGAGIRQTLRVMDFEGSRTGEEAAVTDLEFSYEFADKGGAARLDIRNLFDNQFNWVVDQFVFNGRNPAREYLFSVSLNF